MYQLPFSSRTPTGNGRSSGFKKVPIDHQFHLLIAIHLILSSLFIYRQQNSENGSSSNNKSSKVKSAEAVLAQKKLYQKHLRTLQQSSLARDVLQSKLKPINIIINVWMTFDICLSERAARGMLPAGQRE